MIGVIRVVTLTDSQALASHGRALQQRFGVETRTRCIPDQPYGVHDAATHAEAEPKIVDAARALVDEGAAGILISCAADPALEETRAAVPVPVVGAGSAAAAVAAGLGSRTGVLGITDAVPEAMTRLLGANVLHRRPEGVTTTVDLLNAAGQRHAMNAAGDLVAAGAESIVFACTGYVTIGLSVRLQEQFGIPLVDPVLAGGLLLTYALEGSGLIATGAGSTDLTGAASMRR